MITTIKFNSILLNLIYAWKEAVARCAAEYKEQLTTNIGTNKSQWTEGAVPVQ